MQQPLQSSLTVRTWTRHAPVRTAPSQCRRGNQSPINLQSISNQSPINPAINLQSICNQSSNQSPINPAINLQSICNQSAARCLTRCIYSCFWPKRSFFWGGFSSRARGLLVEKDLGGQNPLCGGGGRGGGGARGIHGCLIIVLRLFYGCSTVVLVTVATVIHAFNNSCRPFPFPFLFFALSGSARVPGVTAARPAADVDVPSLLDVGDPHVQGG